MIRLNPVINDPTIDETPIAKIISRRFLVGVFEENARLLQWLAFFRQFNAIGPLFCSA